MCSNPGEITIRIPPADDEHMKSLRQNSHPVFECLVKKSFIFNILVVIKHKHKWWFKLAEQGFEIVSGKNGDTVEIF